MLLIAESGSSKTDWALLVRNEIYRLNGQGLNPSILGSDEMEHRMEPLKKIADFNPQKIYHYGAGCSAEPARLKLASVYRSIYPQATICIETDLLAATRATCASQPGVVCILGTGSHAALSDGYQITKSYPSLGYILGDFGCATHLAKLFLQHYYTNRFGSEMHIKINSELPELESNFIYHFYHDQGQHEKLARLAHFVVENAQSSEMEELIRFAFNEFIDRQLLPIYSGHDIPIHSVGSIAYFLQHQFHQCLITKNLKPGRCIQKPLDDLIQFHLTYENN